MFIYEADKGDFKTLKHFLFNKHLSQSETCQLESAWEKNSDKQWYWFGKQTQVLRMSRQFFFQKHSVILLKLLFTAIDEKCTKSTSAQTVNGKESYYRLIQR